MMQLNEDSSEFSFKDKSLKDGIVDYDREIAAILCGFDDITYVTSSIYLVIQITAIV